MRAELLAGLVNKIALREFFSGVFFYEGAVISVGDEAYILAVMLFAFIKPFSSAISRTSDLWYFPSGNSVRLSSS